MYQRGTPNTRGPTKPFVPLYRKPLVNLFCLAILLYPTTTGTKPKGELGSVCLHSAGNMAVFFLLS